MKPVRLKKPSYFTEPVSPNGLENRYVARGRGERGKFGNPFKLNDDKHIIRYVTHKKKPDDWVIWDDSKEFRTEDVIELYQRWLNNEFKDVEQLPVPPDSIEELRGKNLICFCKLDEPCHADLLLKLSNEVKQS